MSERLLEVCDLRIRFATKDGSATVVDGIRYGIDAGETLAIVGESGSGKSVSVLSLLRLLPKSVARVTGEVMFRGRDLLSVPERELRRVRGNDISMVFQDPMTSLNPLLTVGRQLSEGIELHLGATPRAARQRAGSLLELVGIAAPYERLDEYPHQFSGGMRQRVMIAMALACDPAVLIADEATTALDVTIQAQIVDLIERLQQEMGLAVVWITHDLSVVAKMADRVLVMYAGQIVESAPVDELFANPRHPYTHGLLGSAPVLGPERPHRLVAIEGLPPDPARLPTGCAFWERCPYKKDSRCERERPPLREVASNHHVACFYEVDRTHLQRQHGGAVA